MNVFILLLSIVAASGVDIAGVMVSPEDRLFCANEITLLLATKHQGEKGADAFEPTSVDALRRCISSVKPQARADMADALSMVGTAKVPACMVKQCGSPELAAVAVKTRETGRRIAPLTDWCMAPGCEEAEAAYLAAEAARKKREAESDKLMAEIRERNRERQVEADQEERDRQESAARRLTPEWKAMAVATQLCWSSHAQSDFRRQMGEEGAAAKGAGLVSKTRLYLLQQRLAATEKAKSLAQKAAHAVKVPGCQDVKKYTESQDLLFSCITEQTDWPDQIDIDHDRLRESAESVEVAVSHCLP